MSHPERSFIISSNGFPPSPSRVGAFFPFPMTQNLNSSQIFWCCPPLSGRMSDCSESALPYPPCQVRDARSCCFPEVWPDPGSLLPGQHPPHEGADEAGTGCFGPGGSLPSALGLVLSSWLSQIRVISNTKSPPRAVGFGVLEITSTCGFAHP